MSDMNMREITLAKFLQFIREQIEDEDYTPIMGIGKSGIGKTEGVAELCKDLGIGFCELRLVTMTETDLLGVPLVKEVKGADGRVDSYTDWASNKLLPIESRDGECGILVLDEITSATSTIRAAAYQLLDSKRSLGNYKLPDKWLVVALGNGIEDGGVYQGMEGAFINRCKAFRVACEYNTWRVWAIKHGVNPAVIGFLQNKQEFLHSFNPDEDVAMFPSPRSWVTLSKMLNKRERKNGGRAIDTDDAIMYACASVGSDVGELFGSFYNIQRHLVGVDDILYGKVDPFKIENTHEEFLIVSNQIIKRLNEIYAEHVINGYEVDKEAVEVTLNTMKFILASKRLENRVALIRDLTKLVEKFSIVSMSDAVLDTDVGKKFSAEVYEKNIGVLA